MFTVTERLCTAVSSSGKVSNTTANRKRHRTLRVTRDGDAVASVGTEVAAASVVVMRVAGSSEVLASCSSVAVVLRIVVMFAVVRLSALVSSSVDVLEGYSVATGSVVELFAV